MAQSERCKGDETNENEKACVSKRPVFEAQNTENKIFQINSLMF